MDIEIFIVPKVLSSSVQNIGYMSDVIQFHNLSHTFISLIGALLLLAIYYNIRTRYKKILEESGNQKRVDSGLLFLSLAMFVWVVAGIWRYAGSHYMFADSFVFAAGVNILSIVNNMFLLLALFYFYYAPTFIYGNRKNIKIIISIIVLVTLSTLVIFHFTDDTIYGGMKLNSLPDLLLSGFLSGLLATTLYRTFDQRGLKVVAMLSVLVVGLIFYSQLPDVFLKMDNGFVNQLIKIIAKTSLISIFLVLATTWVIQLANTPKVNEMQLRFDDWCLIKLSIPSKNINDVQIDFGSKTTQYKNLLKFALRRKYGSGDEQSILVGASGEIKNQTYLSRIIDNIKDIHPMTEGEELERKDLFTFLGEGRYRLRMLPEHILIDDNLLQEFVRSPENKEYSILCN